MNQLHHQVQINLNKVLAGSELEKCLLGLTHPEATGRNKNEI